MMAANDNPWPMRPTPTREELDACINRIQMKLAEHQAIAKKLVSMTAATDVDPCKTDAELDAEDALLFRPQPLYLGLGHPIPENYLVSEEDRSKKNLHVKFGKGLQASKRRDTEEKAESAKRALKEDSEDEGGRSSLGKKKKLKTALAPETTNEVKEMKIAEIKTAKKEKKARVQEPNKLVKEVKVSEAIPQMATPPTTPEKPNLNTTATTTDQIQDGQAATQGGEEETQGGAQTGKEISEAWVKHMKERKILKKKLKRKATRAEWKKTEGL